MKHFILTLTFAALLTLGTGIFSPAHAAGQQVVVGVNGMVCDFCARALEKVFGEHDAVDNIKVDMDASTVTVNLKDGATLDNDKITSMITDSGYNVREINRGAE